MNYYGQQQSPAGSVVEKKKKFHGDGGNATGWTLDPRRPPSGGGMVDPKTPPPDGSPVQTPIPGWTPPPKPQPGLDPGPVQTPIPGWTPPAPGGTPPAPTPGVGTGGGWGSWTPAPPESTPPAPPVAQPGPKLPAPPAPPAPPEAAPPMPPIPTQPAPTPPVKTPAPNYYGASVPAPRPQNDATAKGSLATLVPGSGGAPAPSGGSGPKSNQGAPPVAGSVTTTAKPTGAPAATSAPAPSENPQSVIPFIPDGSGGNGGAPPPASPPGKPDTQGGTGGTGGGMGSNASTGWGIGTEYQSATDGLVGYYGRKMDSQGMDYDAYSNLVQSSMLPIERQAAQAREQMTRARAATGNDAGIYAGVAQTSKDAAAAKSDAMRKNVLTNEEVKRQQQAEGAAGNLNLYGQTQAETMEYLRMLGNLLGRQDYITTSGSTSGGSAGINWNPGGATM